MRKRKVEQDMEWDLDVCVREREGGGLGDLDLCL